MRLFFTAELHPIQLSIQAVYRHQLVVGTGLADALAVYVQDFVRPTDGGQSVCDHQRGAPGGKLVESGLDARFGDRVERRCRFVHKLRLYPYQSFKQAVSIIYPFVFCVIHFAANNKNPRQKAHGSI